MKIPNLRKISGEIIKPKNKHASVMGPIYDYPYNFKIVFTIKGMAEAFPKESKVSSVIYKYIFRLELFIM